MPRVSKNLFPLLNYYSLLFVNFAVLGTQMRWSPLTSFLETQKRPPYFMMSSGCEGSDADKLQLPIKEQSRNPRGEVRSAVGGRPTSCGEMTEEE